MTSLTIKNMPQKLYEDLKSQATLHRRSMNSEIIFRLEQTIQEHPYTKQLVLKAARKIREKTAKYKLTQKKLNAIKGQGRP